MLYHNNVWIYKDFLTNAECEVVHATAEKHELMSGRIGYKNNDPDAPPKTDGQQNSEIRQSDVRWIPHNSFVEEISQKIEDGINSANREAGWNLLWDQPESHQYTIYHHRPEAEVKGDHYTWHIDSSPDWQGQGERIRKLSSTLQLSDPNDYEGGHFQYINPNGIFDKLKRHEEWVDMQQHITTLPFSAKSKGTLIVFPSHTYHQVTPVTRGTRISLVSWFHGPKHV
tara:strand:- start:2671 stop:3351 length:681 start_codon:yes stop_codon:yes gene_type:complete